MRLDEAEQVLGLVRPYDEEGAKKAFRSAARRTHPDHGGEERDFKRVAEAKELLDEIFKKMRERREAASAVDPFVADLLGRVRPREAEEETADDDPFGLGETFGAPLSVLHLQIDGRAHPAPTRFRAWISAGGKGLDHLVVVLEPPSAIRVVGTVELVVVFGGDSLSDALSFRGTATDHRRDEDHMVTRFSVAAVSQGSAGRPARR